MEQSHRDVLQSNHMALVNDLEADTIASNLFEVGILDENDKDEIKAKTTSREKAELLLDKLPRKGPTAFIRFCDALRDISPHLEAYLRPFEEKGKSSNGNGNVCDTISVDGPATVDKKPIPSTTIKQTSVNAGDHQDGAGNSKCHGGGASSLMDMQSIYCMDKSPRGKAVIINNKTFLPASDMQDYPRNGTDVDRDALEKTFKKLMFDTVVYNDQTVKETKKILKELGSIDYSNYNALIVAILTHGEEGVLYATDGTIEIRDMMKYFKGTNLVGKPKLFFFQACQGIDYMDGEDAVDAPLPEKLIHKLPIEADFLYAYSTVPGYFSWRSSVKGSWFIQSIVEVFDKYGQTMDVLRMMTRVNALVSTYESRTNKSNSNRKKQMPSIVSMLRKDLYFFPEYVVEN